MSSGHTRWCADRGKPRHEGHFGADLLRCLSADVDIPDVSIWVETENDLPVVRWMAEQTLEQAVHVPGVVPLLDNLFAVTVAGLSNTAKPDELLDRLRPAAVALRESLWFAAHDQAAKAGVHRVWCEDRRAKPSEGHRAEDIWWCSSATEKRGDIWVWVEDTSGGGQVVIDELPRCDEARRRPGFEEALLSLLAASTAAVNKAADLKSVQEILAATAAAISDLLQESLAGAA